jgi:hypothetical protein
MAVIDGGVNTAGKANVSTNYQLSVQTPTVKEQSGFVGLAGIVDDGSVTGTPKVNRVMVTEAQKLATAHSVILWEDDFGVSAQNTAKYSQTNATYTATFNGQFYNINTTNSLTGSASNVLTTYRTFPLFAKADLKVSTRALFTASPQTNTAAEIGLFKAAGITAPTDGIFFRYNIAGELRGVVNTAGTETQTAAITPPAANLVHEWTIVIHAGAVFFYIDDVLVGKVTMLTDIPTLGGPTGASALPWAVRLYNNSVVPTTAQQLKVYDVVITLVGPELGRPLSHTMAGMGLSAYQGQNGGTMGSSALYSNNLAAGAGAAATNTTAALGSGLGGQFSVQPTLVVGTDGIICNFANPAGSTTQPGKNLVITGVKIQGLVTTALTGGPVYYAYSLAFGHTNLNLTTAEAATTKASRRIALGYETYVVTAPVGTLGSPSGVAMTFLSPVVVQPGENIAIVAKNLGTVTTAGVITILVAFDGYYE